MSLLFDEDVSVESLQMKSVDEDGTSSTRRVVAKLHREESSISSGGDLNDYTAPTTQDDLNLPPGRMNAVKGTHRLQGSFSNLSSLLHSRLTGTETPRSRSISPSMKDRAAGTVTGYTSTTHDGNSSISSCDESSTHALLPDNDIFTDRAGFADDLAENIRRMHNSREFLNLPPTVNERMTEDTLEDTQAFSDLQVPRTRSSNASLVSGVSSVANEAVLEPLDECEEGLEDSDSDDEGRNDGGLQHKNHPTIILTNMENLNLNQERILEEEDDDAEDDGDVDGAVSQMT